MSFTLLVCSDIRARKVNLELPFPSHPSSIEELSRIVQEVFRVEEMDIKKAMGLLDARPCEPFTINRLQRYDDDDQSWASLSGIDSLQPYDQLYVFRRNTAAADISTQRELPPPRRSKFFDAVCSSTVSRTEVPRSEELYGPPVDCPHNGTTVQNSLPLQQHTPGRAPPNYSPHSVAHTSADQQPFPVEMHQSATKSDSAAYLPTAASLPYRFPGNHIGGESTTRHHGLTPPPKVSRPTTVLEDSSSRNLIYRERTTQDRTAYLFQVGDATRQGFLTARDLEGIFRASDIRFPSAVIEDLHLHFARGGRMTKEEFSRYAVDFPVAVNIAYQRLTNQQRERELVAAQREHAHEVQSLQRQARELEERLTVTRRTQEQHEKQCRKLQEDVQTIYQQRDPSYREEEQRLLDKEVSVFKYRERLSREEEEYERLAIERRRRSLQREDVSLNYDRTRYGPM